MKKYWAEVYNNFMVYIKRMWYRERISFIGVSIIVVVLIGLAILPSKDKRIYLAAQQVMDLASSVRRHFQAKPNYWGLNTEQAIAAGIVPEKMIQNGNVVNALNKKVLLGLGENGEPIIPGSIGFDVIYKDINPDICREMLMYPFSEEQRLGIRSISVVNSELVTFEWGGENPLPVTEEQAKKVCNKNCSIIWSFE